MWVLMCDSGVDVGKGGFALLNDHCCDISPVKPVQDWGDGEVSSKLVILDQPAVRLHLGGVEYPSENCRVVTCAVAPGN